MGLSFRDEHTDLSLNILGFPHIGTALTAAANIDVINELLGPGVYLRFTLELNQDERINTLKSSSSLPAVLTCILALPHRG